MNQQMKEQLPPSKLHKIRMQKLSFILSVSAILLISIIVVTISKF